MSTDWKDLPPEQRPRIAELISIEGSVATVGEFLCPQWDVISEWVEVHVPEHLWDQAYYSFAWQWVCLLREHYGGEYQVHSSPGFLLLADVSDEDACYILRLLEELNERISTLIDVEESSRLGPQVVLLFGDVDDHATYLASHTTGDVLAHGMFFPEGYGHIVALNPGSKQSLTAVLTHELVHAEFQDLALPLWLDEGATQIVTDELLGRQTALPDGRKITEVQLYWNAERIQHFWSGAAFSQTGDSPKAYPLSVILCKLLASFSSGNFIEFLKAAEIVDAGEAAANEVYGLSLGNVAAEFLGEGDWAPRPETWMEPATDDT